jgi:formate hydrogenlyase subunit 4
MAVGRAMNGATVLAGAVQLIGGIVLAPLLPGLTQSFKARLQGRRGPSPLQPYRELRRLWSRSMVDPEGTTVLYRLAPLVVAACLIASLLLVPVGGRSPGWPTGNDVLLLVGILALSRFALAAASWDTGSGFSLMSASRDLMLSVSAEGLLLLGVILIALPAGSTDLLVMSDAGTGAGVWSVPAHWIALAAFLLVVLVEVGRQPIDNPDTHLELTMIHEGPLLEYAGRDLAYLQWAAAARHWVMLTLTVELLAPRPLGFTGRLVVLVVGLPVLCVVLAVVETWLAKMRLLRVPRLLAVATGLCLLGLITWLIGGRL